LFIVNKMVSFNFGVNKKGFLYKRNQSQYNLIYTFSMG
jgi:hypothetical protein